MNGNGDTYSQPWHSVIGPASKKRDVPWPEDFVTRVSSPTGLKRRYKPRRTSSWRTFVVILASEKVVLISS